MIRIFIVEDHDLTRMTMRYSFDDIDGICVAGDAESGERFFEMLPATEVDVVLLDIRLDKGKLQGAEVARRLRRDYPHIKILAVSMENDYNTVQEMLNAGIDGFVSKQKGSPEKISEAVRSVMEGLEYFTQDISSILSNVFISKTKNSELNCDLTEQELRVLKLCGDGLQGKEIADRLNISVNTVNKHKQNIYKKVGLNSTAEVALYALRKGIIQMS